MPALSCRFYKNKFPEVEDVVMVNVRSIAEMGAYVDLSEYNNIEGKCRCITADCRLHKIASDRMIRNDSKGFERIRRDSILNDSEQPVSPKFDCVERKQNDTDVSINSSAFNCE